MDVVKKVFLYIFCWALAAVQSFMGILSIAFSGLAMILTLWVRRIFGFIFAVGGLISLFEEDWYTFFSVLIIAGVFYLIPHTINAIAGFFFITSALLFAAPIIYTIEEHKSPIQYIEAESGSGAPFTVRCYNGYTNFNNDRAEPMSAPEAWSYRNLGKMAAIAAK